MKNINSRHSAAPYVTAVLSSCLFGLSYIFTKNALKTASPMELVSFRFLLAFIIMTILVKAKVMSVNYKNKPVRWLALLSFFEPVMYFIFETYGLKYTAASIGGLMISLIPIVVTILAAYLLKEIPNAKSVMYIIISVSGVILIVLMDSSKKGGSTSLIGILLLFGAVFSAALFNITSRRISKKFTPFEITYFMMFSGALSFNVLSICGHILNGNIKDYFAPLKSMTFIESILYLGVASSIIAYFLINYSLAKLKASTISVFSNISTIVSIVSGVIVLHEKFYFYHIIGSILIIAGVLGTNLVELNQVKREK